MINSRSIQDLRHDVRDSCSIFLECCKTAGLDVLITQTLRDDEYQATLYAQGRTNGGQIVTNSRKVTFHNGLAFDICKNVKGHEYDDPDFFRACAQIAKGIGFTWGGDWKLFPDYPHFQWDANGKAAYTNVPEMKFAENYAQLQKRGNFANSTMIYLSSYRYASSLFEKLLCMD